MVEALKNRLLESQSLEGKFIITKEDINSVMRAETNLESIRRITQKIIQISDETLVGINLSSDDKISLIEQLINCVIKIRNLCIDEVSECRETIGSAKTVVSDKSIVKRFLAERSIEIADMIKEFERIEKKLDAGESLESRKIGQRPEKLRSVRAVSKKKLDKNNK